VSDTHSSDSTPSDTSTRVVELTAENARLFSEREQYRKLYLDTLETCRKLEQGILGQKRERLTGEDASTTLSLLSMLLGEEQPAAAPAAEPTEVQAHTRQKPTGRRPLPENLPRVDVEVLPPEVQSQGLDAFERIGEDVTETVERRPGSLVVVRTHKPKFVPKDRKRNAETQVLQAAPPELPIERGLAGPGLLADTIVRRWQDHLPLNRLERIYGREGLVLPRATVCDWHLELAKLVRPLIWTMWQDALKAPYLCTDATGVLVQAKEKCRLGHFWVVVAPELHVMFGYTPKHDAAAVDKLLRGYKGDVVADAHVVFDHLFAAGATEVGCWSHHRRYYFKSLGSDPDRARHALAYFKALFQIERGLAQAPPEERLSVRQEKSKPLVDALFAWCDEQADRVLDETPIAHAIGYGRNQRDALRRFLDDGRLPMHNNVSERQLRREAVGRKNWVFLGSDFGGEANSSFVTLLASCQLHEIEPWAYLRDLFCLLPGWPVHRVLELAPAYWSKTSANDGVQRALAANIFRQATLGPSDPHRTTA
jgi:transposase